MLDLLVRNIETIDLTQIVAIERNAQISPWGRIAFEESLNMDYRCRCIEVERKIIGYSVTQTIIDEVHILNLVIAPSAQGRGFAHDLLDDIFSFAQNNSIQRVYLEVRESNEVAKSLYAKWGFQTLSLRKNYYRTGHSGQRENALILTRELA